MTIQRSESIKELATDLAKAQGQLKPASKDSTNPHLKSKYADLASVWDACRGPLAEHGLSVVQLPTDAEGDRVALTTILLHSSGEWMSSTYSLKPAQNTAHGVGSALTYLRRYALAAMIGIVADEDDDGNSNSLPKPQRQQAPRASLPSEASYEPPPERQTLPPGVKAHPMAAREQPRKNPSREAMIARILALTEEAATLELEIELAKPLAEMTEAELIQHGRNLNQAIAEAQARDLAPAA